MWFLVLSILLITTLIVHGSGDSQLAIKELHYEISKVTKEVQELYVERDTAQIALDEKAKKVLEEYIQLDISSGLPEQVQLLNLKDKAEDVKTSEETRKAVVNGLELLERVKGMKSDENKLLDVVVRELKAIEETKEAKIYMNKEYLKDIIEGLGDYHLLVLKKWIPIQNYLKNLKVPTGDLTESLTNIEECLLAFDFSMDFSTEETESLKLEEAFKDVRVKKDIYFDIMKNVEEFKLVTESVKNMMKWFESEQKDWDELDNILKEFGTKGKHLIAKVPELDNVLFELQDSLEKLDTAVFGSIKTVTDGITSKITKIKEFLNCYSSLKIVPFEVKSLMDQPKEVWNFDARPLESVLEVVYLFKEAHRFSVEKKQLVPIDGFPLTKEEVTGISDGLRILKAILDYQKLWNEIPLTEELIQLEIHSNLPAVRFPKDIDSLINFYSTQYQGPQRRRILKILESVKDYSQFPSKLEKMNEAVGKWKNWRKEQNPEEQTVDGEELIDCSERSCELTLPEVNPEEKIEL